MPGEKGGYFVLRTTTKTEVPTITSKNFSIDVV